MNFRREGDLSCFGAVLATTWTVAATRGLPIGISLEGRILKDLAWVTIGAGAGLTITNG